MSHTIELTETQKAAYTHIVSQQSQIQQQIAILQNQFNEIQEQMVNVSKEVFEAADVDFEDVVNPVLSDDRATITYNLISEQDEEATDEE
jgi:chromosome segregation ATPase